MSNFVYFCLLKSVLVKFVDVLDDFDGKKLLLRWVCSTFKQRVPGK
jgi:hypothetical protein